MHEHESPTTPRPCVVVSPRAGNDDDDDDDDADADDDDDDDDAGGGENLQHNLKKSSIWCKYDPPNCLWKALKDNKGRFFWENGNGDSFFFFVCWSVTLGSTLSLGCRIWHLGSEGYWSVSGAGRFFVNWPSNHWVRERDSDTLVRSSFFKDMRRCII